MNDIKLILLDMDGTLCDGNGQVPKEFYSLVKKLRQKNISIGIASGRNGGTIRDCFGSYFNEMACVTTNGTVIYVDGKIISKEFLPKKAVKTILDIANTLPNCSVQTFFSETVLMNENNPLFQMFNEAGFCVKAADDLYEYMDDVVLMSTVATDWATDLSSYFKGNDDLFKMTISGSGVIDYMPVHASKAYGAKKLAEYFNISENQIMAIGDAGNDLELLQSVGHPVAMKNAMEEVKEIAKYITEKPNTENGCIEFIKEFFGVE